MNYLFVDLIAVSKHMKNLFNSLIEFLRHSKKTVLLILIVAATTLIFSTMISIWLSRFGNYLIPSLGTIHTTGVNASIQFIDWGTIYPGTLTNHSFHVQSQSNIETTLNLTAANWTFRDSEGNNVTGSLPIKPADAMNVTWNYTGALVSPGKKIYVTLTLWASNDIRFINYLIDKRVEEFSFDMHIYAKE
jgi:hypothetical protein